MTTLCIFEDEAFAQLYPLTYLRPTFDLLCGASYLGDRILAALPDATPAFLCRSFLHPTARERRRLLESPFDVGAGGGDVLFVNGRLLEPRQLLAALPAPSEGPCLLLAGPQLVAARLPPALAQEAAYFLMEQDARGLVGKLGKLLPKVEVAAPMADYLWDLLGHNEALIQRDFAERFAAQASRGEVHPSSVLYNERGIHLGRDACVEAMCVLDARPGPIIVDEGAIIEPFSYLRGPAYVGRGTRIVSGLVRGGTSIGPVSRIGGEVETSIIQGFANKYHAGFLGHSVVGEWVNIGAMASNSDLKNTYGRVRVEMGGGSVDSGATKVGIFVGDHAKIGIASVAVAGATIGVASSLFGSPVPKVVPCFVWTDGTRVSEYRLENCLAVAREVMARRGTELTGAQANLLRHVFYQTLAERQAMLA